VRIGFDAWRTGLLGGETGFDGVERRFLGAKTESYGP
jgi:hypothetical protein